MILVCQYQRYRSLPSVLSTVISNSVANNHLFMLMTLTKCNCCISAGRHDSKC